MDDDSIWTWKGEIGRAQFFLGAGGLYAIAYNLHRLIAWALADLYFTPITYARPFESGALPADERSAFVWIALTTLPFAWMVVGFFVRRLRAIRAPRWLAGLALAPVVNMVMYLVLAAIPEHDGASRRLSWVPDSAWGAATAGLVVPTIPAILGTLAAVHGFEEYGLGLFVAVPFCAGLGAAVLYGAHRQRTLGRSIVVACGSILVLGMTILAVAIEGVLCLAMAAPIGLGLAAIGGGVGHAVASHVRGHRQVTTTLVALALASPLLMGFEALDDSRPPLHEITTTVEIDAPPESVWEQVVVFSELPEPDEFWFESGIAYPTHARIEGHGPGAVRYCEFSTGAFVEPIEVWDAPHLLAFRVEDQPPSMEELSPWGHIDAPHIDEFLRSERGEFRLVRLPDGGTRLEGTTWYRHEIWPASYWRLWSDAIIHSIHTRVLGHIKSEAEREPFAVTQGDSQSAPRSTHSSPTAPALIAPESSTTGSGM